MGDAQTAPVFSPDGTLGDIPVKKLPAALKAGFKPGVTMKSGDGTLGVVPSDRVQEASKSGLQVVPFKEQETQHTGFWASLGGDLAAMLPHLARNGDQAPDMSGRVGAATKLNDQQNAQQAAEDAARKKAGYSDTYTALAPFAEGLGANVKGMEQSAKEGDARGVLGHAAAVPTVMAATEGVAKIPAVTSATIDAAKPLIRNASDAVQAAADSKIGQTVSTVAKAGAKLADVSTFERLSKGANVLRDGVQKLADIWRTPGASLNDMTDHLAQVIADDRAQRAEALNKPVRSEGLAEVEQGKSAATQLLKDATAPKDATGKELGLIKSTGAKSAAETGEALANPPESSDTPTGGKAASAPRFTIQDRLRAKELLQDSLSRGTQQVVDSVIPKTDAPAANLKTKAAVDFSLQRGDVAGAEQAVDAAAQKANPSWQPLQRQPAPTVDEIRARIKQGPGSKADSLETRGIQEQMRDNLQSHGWSAASEARREFIARNSNYFNKSGKSRGYVPGEQVKLTTTPSAAASGKGTPAAGSATDDLTDILQQSLDAARKRQSQK